MSPSCRTKEMASDDHVTNVWQEITTPSSNLAHLELSLCFNLHCYGFRFCIANLTAESRNKLPDSWWQTLGFTGLKWLRELADSSLCFPAPSYFP